MSDTYIYKFENNLYINLTNKCSNRCAFCLRNNGDGIGGNTLWLKREPTAAEVIALIDEQTASGQEQFGEVVFCGYGESTYRLAQVLEIAAHLKSKGYKTRLDTNGQGSLINGYDITDKLVGAIDTVSISLNQSSAQKYNDLCAPDFENAFDQLIIFAKSCAQKGIKTIMSVVDTIDKEDIKACEQIANQAGAEFRVREYIE